VTSSKATVYVVDDDASVLRSLGRLLQSAKYKVESFASGRDFLDYPLAAGPACLVLDVRMPGITGLELQEAVAARHRPLPIVFITGHGDIPMSVRAMKAGAVDFLTKPYSADALLDAVRRALTLDVAEQSERVRSREIEQLMTNLTQREGEVFALVVAGLLNKQIAWEMSISEKTVKVHRARVMEKMGADSVADLVRMAGVVRPPWRRSG